MSYEIKKGDRGLEQIFERRCGNSRVLEPMLCCAVWVEMRVKNRLTVPNHGLLPRHLAWWVGCCCSKIVVSSGIDFEARHWRLVSVCELRMFFDELKMFDRII